jgi:hypothetical protein
MPLLAHAALGRGRHHSPPPPPQRPWLPQHPPPPAVGPAWGPSDGPPAAAARTSSSSSSSSSPSSSSLRTPIRHTEGRTSHPCPHATTSLRGSQSHVSARNPQTRMGLRVTHGHNRPAQHGTPCERRSELWTLSLRARMVLQVEACTNHSTARHASRPSRRPLTHRPCPRLRHPRPPPCPRPRHPPRRHR